MRDDKWLFAKLDETWDEHFSDVPQENDVHIVWGRRARGRLGTIKQVPQNIKNSKFDWPEKSTSGSPREIKNSVLLPTVITINSLFKDESIPEYVVVGTIAHELAHYAHGFHSPLEQKFATPHAGGVVHKEMDARGLREVRLRQHRWLKENWRQYLEDNFPRKKPRKRRIIIRWI